LFGRPGTVYVYLIYGMYHCLNAVTEAEGFPAAVLIRAVRPVDGIAWMRANRGGVGETDIASGPGKLCQALGISRDFNESSLEGDRLWIEDRGLPCSPIRTSPRIGVDYAGEYRDKPWRFFAADNDHVTRHRFNRFARVGGSAEGT
jgi:DNA-3-methyladenine glycosylase